MKHSDNMEEPSCNVSGWPVLEIGRHKKGGLVEQIVIGTWVQAAVHSAGSPASTSAVAAVSGRTKLCSA